MRGRKPTPLPVRFWARVEKRGTDECWPWQGPLNQWGYGRIVSGGRLVMAHRVAYELQRGPIPDGMLVLHHCDYPACMNGAHLFIGTNADNMADMARKGRAALTKFPERALKGERNGSSKLTSDQVEQIRATYASARELAARFGVSRGTILRIRRGLRWAHIKSDLAPAYKAHGEDFKNRVALKGEEAGAAKLTEEQVREIYATPGTLDEIAARFGVSRSTIWFIKHRKAWRHILPDGPPGANRRARGERTGSAVLTESLVREIRALAAGGLPTVRIAEQLGLGWSAVDHVRHGRTWNHVK